MQNLKGDARPLPSALKKRLSYEISLCPYSLSMSVEVVEESILLKGLLIVMLGWVNILLWSLGERRHTFEFMASVPAPRPQIPQIGSTNISIIPLNPRSFLAVRKSERTYCTVQYWIYITVVGNSNRNSNTSSTSPLNRFEIGALRAFRRFGRMFFILFSKIDH